MRSAALSLCLLSAACQLSADPPRLPDAGHVDDTPPDAGPDTTPDAGSPTASIELGGQVTEDVEQVTPAGRTSRLVVLWDAWRGSESYPLKFGEGTVADGTIALRLAAAPPDEVLAHGSVGVGQLVVVPTEAVLPDGELGLDAADELLGTALGGAAGTVVVFRSESSTRFPWLDAFPDGYSCARADGSGGFTPSACTQLSARMAAPTADGDLPFDAWGSVATGQPRSE